MFRVKELWIAIRGIQLHIESINDFLCANIESLLKVIFLFFGYGLCYTDSWPTKWHDLKPGPVVLSKMVRCKIQNLAYTCYAEFSKCSADTGKPVFRMGQPYFTIAYIQLSPSARLQDVVRALHATSFPLAFLPGPGYLVLGPVFETTVWPSARELWRKSCEKQVPTLLSSGAAFKLRSPPLLSPQVTFAAVPEPDHCQLAWLLSLNLNLPPHYGCFRWSGLLADPGWSQHSLENHPVSYCSTSFHSSCGQSANLQGWPQVILETISTGGVPQPWPHQLVCPDRLSVSRLGGSCVREHAMSMVLCQRLYRHRQNDLQS